MHLTFQNLAIVGFFFLVCFLYLQPKTWLSASGILTAEQVFDSGLGSEYSFNHYGADSTLNMVMNHLFYSSTRNIILQAPVGSHVSERSRHSPLVWGRSYAYRHVFHYFCSNLILKGFHHICTNYVPICPSSSFIPSVSVSSLMSL